MMENTAINSTFSGFIFFDFDVGEIIRESVSENADSPVIECPAYDRKLFLNQESSVKKVNSNTTLSGRCIT